MTPKEKANELIEQFTEIMCERDCWNFDGAVKDCALICLNQLRDKNEDLKYISLADYVDGFEYLNQLETEINNYEG